MLRSLLFHLFMLERVKTSQAKAKVMAPLAEKLITMAKKGTLDARRNISRRLPAAGVKKLVRIIAPRMMERHGGYTRIIKLEPRKSDSSRMAIIELIN